jgi:hypothetical protein
VPLTNSSITDCVFELAKPTTVEEVNRLLQVGHRGRELVGRCVWGGGGGRCGHGRGGQGGQGEWGLGMEHATSGPPCANAADCTRVSEALVLVFWDLGASPGVESCCRDQQHQH